MARFLVETYTPAASFEEIDERVRAVARECGRVRYLRSIFVPDDEVCFHLFEAESLEVVREAAERARLGAQRVVEAIA